MVVQKNNFIILLVKAMSCVYLIGASHIAHATSETPPPSIKQPAIVHTTLTVEEQRIPDARKAMPEALDRHQARIKAFDKQLQQVRNFTALTQVIFRHGKAIWQEGVTDFSKQDDYDDRPLYWARLQMLAALRSAPAFKQLLDMQQSELLWKFELLSRGQQDIKFDKKADKKILLTGFDPFFLDKNIDQSNPSGVAALALDNFLFHINGKSFEIETLIVPVRFADFDQGMIETLLRPYFTNQQVDMVLTVSMGRSDFDLERFPSLRRSAKAPDNLNVFTGATAQNPLVPLLGSQALKGNEFVEFSLPAKAMQTIQSPYKVNNNAKVTTLNETLMAKNLAQLAGQISVQGSGGGYLSNEISYRSILLRNSNQPIMPVGHIHTPRMAGFDQQQLKQIIKQLKAIIAHGAATLPK